MANQGDISYGLSIGANQSVRRNAGDSAFEAFTAGDTAGKLSQFSATTSSELAGVISDETGSGALVFGTDPTFTTRINVPEIKATGAGGIDVHNNTGTQVALFGAGGTTGSTLTGTTNIGSASADYHQVAGGTGTITNTATGSSTNINMNFVPKGTGTLQSGGVNVLTETMTIDTKNPTGFIDNENIQVDYDYTNRTITLTGTLTYYFNGRKYTLTSPWTSSAHTNSTGTYYLSSSDGTNFTWSTSPWLFSYVQVAFVNRGASAATSFALREVHGIMDWKSHEEFHSQIGTYRVSGGILTVGTYAENTATDAANSPGFDLATIKDEDVLTTIPAWTEGTYTTMYIGASSTATFDTTATLPFRSSGSYLLVNNPTTGAETAGINNRYYNVYQILVPCAADTDSQKYRVIMLQPQATHTSLANAQLEDPRSLSLGNFTSLSPEFVLYARITYVTAVGDANTGKCRIATGGVSYLTGNRLGQVSITGFNPTDHSALDNIDWLNSGHTGSNLAAPLFSSTGTAVEVVPTANQSIRINSGGTAWEAYTPSSGVSWGTSISSGTGTGLAMTTADLAGDKPFITKAHTASGTLTACTTTQSSLTMSRTHTNASSVTDNYIGQLFSRTNIMNQAGGTLLAQGSVVNITGTDTQTAGTLTPSYHLLKLDPSLLSTGSSLFVNVANSTSAPTNGHIYALLGSTQSVAHDVIKIDFGTAAVAHKAINIKAYGNSSTQVGLYVDMSTTGDGDAIQIFTPSSSAQSDVLKIGSRLRNGANGSNAKWFNFVSKWGNGIMGSQVANFQFQRRINAGNDDNYDMFFIERDTDNQSGATRIQAGSVMHLKDKKTETSGAITNNVNILKLTTESASTGKLITGIVGSTERFSAQPQVANSGTNTAYLFDTSTSLSGTTKIASFANAGTEKFAIDNAGAITIGNTVNSVSPTAPNRTITMVIGGTTYYIHAKTTND